MILLNSVCYYFVEDLSIYIYQRYQQGKYPLVYPVSEEDYGQPPDYANLEARPSGSSCKVCRLTLSGKYWDMGVSTFSLCSEHWRGMRSECLHPLRIASLFATVLWDLRLQVPLAVRDRCLGHPSLRLEL